MKKDTKQWVPIGSGAKVLTIDIETFPHLVYTWGLFKQYVSLDQIVRNWSLAAVCWKWLHEKRTHYLDCEDNPLDDSALLAAVWEALDEADIVVGHNVNHFDLRKINARLIESGYPPPEPYKRVDTKVEAKRVAMFTSNKLEWLAEHLAEVRKDRHKEFPGFELWAECLKGNPRAWASMRRYNPRDVIATEQVYLKLRPWIVGHPNLAAYNPDQSEPACPKCGSENMQRRGVARTQSGVYHRMQCRDCGGWSRTRYTLNSIEDRRNLLSN